MSIENHVDLVITADAVSLPRAGFGIPGVLSYNASFPERVQLVTRPSDVTDLGFATDSPEYLAIAAMSSQRPRPATMAILRGTLAPTLTYTVRAASVANSTTYAIRVRGEGVTNTLVEHDSAASASRAEIHAGLVTELNAVDGKNFTAALAPLVFADKTVSTVDATDDELDITAHGLTTGDGPVRIETTGTAPGGLTTATDYWVIVVNAGSISLAASFADALDGEAIDITDAGSGTHTIVDTASTVSADDDITVTGSAAGDWFSLEVINTSLVTAYMSHGDPGVATDLTAIQNENDSWFWLVTLYNSEDYIDAASTWIQTQKKFYWAGSNDTRDLGTSTGSAGALDVLKTAARNQTAGFYHHRPNEFAGAAITGNLAPREIGSWTAKFKTLSGVATTTLTPTQRANLVARHANFYESVAGVSILSEGTTSAGPTVVRGFVDDVVNLFWVEDDMQKGVFGAMAGAAKIPRTDPGMTTIENQIRGTLQRAVGRTVAAADPEFVVEIPKIADQEDLLPRSVRASFSFTLAGAVHKALITGVVLL
jgi:hypothetical protein